jgi:hypothetical protein
MLWGFKPVGFEGVERPRRIGEEFSWDETGHTLYLKKTIK